MPKQFDWDDKNAHKNWNKHHVSVSECEEIFLNEPLLIADVDKSKILYRENRAIAHGTTNAGRMLFVVFTIRGEKVRVISARDMNRKERRFYHDETKKAAPPI